MSSVNAVAYTVTGHAEKKQRVIHNQFKNEIIITFVAWKKLEQ